MLTTIANGNWQLAHSKLRVVNKWSVFATPSAISLEHARRGQQTRRVAPYQISPIQLPFEYSSIVIIVSIFMIPIIAFRMQAVVFAKAASSLQTLATNYNNFRLPNNRGHLAAS